MVNRCNPIETTYDEDHIVYDFDGEVTSRVVHVRDLRPGVGGRIELFTAAHPGDPVEASYDVYVAMISYTGDARTTRAHRTD